MALPEEVLQRIFVFLDGVSVIKCRRVCSVWLHEAEKCERLPNFWRQKCIEEVGWDFLPSYIEKINPIFFDDKQIDFSWKDIYICWYRWHSLKHWQSKLKELDINRPGEIIRAEFYGNWIVYATKDYNTLVACHMDFPACSEKVLYEGARLKHFQFLTSSSDPTHLPFGVVFISTERASCFVDVQTRKVIGRSTISLNDDNSLQEIIIDSKMEQLIAINPDAEDSQFTIPKSIKKFNDYVVMSPKGKTVGYENVITQTRWLILHHKVALGISTTPDLPRHVVVFVVGRRHKIYYPSINFGNITAAMLHGNNFFLGTSNATLHHYTIKNIDDFLDFDFFQCDWSITDEVACSHYECIRSIDVCELYRRPCIALAIGQCRIVIVDFLGDEQTTKLMFPNVLRAMDFV